MPKNYFKKTLAGIFALAIVASATPLAPFAPLLDSISITASAAEATAEGLEYEESEDGKSITITGYSGTSPDVVIPAEIDGKPVTVIGEEAFHGTGIQTIVLNEGLERIEACAFWESSITSVTFPKSLCYIGASAFYFCENLEYVRFLNSNCEMGYDNCFSPFIECDNNYGGCFLKTVYCPTGSSEYYCDWGFNGNHEGGDGAWTFVEESPIPDSTLRWSLDENGVMTISGDDEAFPAFSDEMGNWTHWCDAYSNVTSIVFETPYLTSIGSGAFADFTGLTSLELPDTVESIGKDAFNNCSRLASVELPAALLSLGQGAFFGCSALEEVVLPSAVTTIGQAAFGCCSKLISVTIPKSVKSIDVDLFFECQAMETVNYTGTADEWNAISIGSSNSVLNNIPITYVKAAQKILDSNLTYEIDEEGVLTISGLDEAFPECLVNNAPVEWCDKKNDVKEIVFATPKLTSLGSAAFYGFKSLTSITIPASVTEIGQMAFQATSLSTITFAGNMPEIGLKAFDKVGTDTAPATLYYPNGNSSWEDFLKTQEETFELGNGYFKAQTIPTAKAKGYSVSYNGDVTINFHYLVSESYKNGYVKFSDDTVVNVEDTVTDANGYCVFPISMPAKNMYDEITAQFYDANDVAVGDAVTFDLVTYMDKVKAYDPNYTNFVDSFLEYGAQAAAYFGVIGAPAGKTYSDSDFMDISNALEANYASTNNMGDTFVGATLLLKSTPKLRLYYSEDPGNYSTNEKNPDLFYTEKEISPVKFGTEDLNGYYVYNYIYKAMNSNDASLKPLCAAFYNMSKAIPTIG